MKAIERMYIYFNDRNIKPSVFEKELGFGSGYFSVQKNRNADMGESVLVKILDKCRDINPIWLLLGQGEMSNEQQFQNEKIETQTTNNNSEASESIILELVRQIRSLSEENGTLKAKLNNKTIES